MVKYLTRHSRHKDFFSELQENEIFMYSYHDYKLEDVIKIAKENMVTIECVQKGTENYRKYGECAVKVIKMSGRAYEYKLSSGEVIKIEARDEKTARAMFLEYLFNNNYVVLMNEATS